MNVSDGRDLSPWTPAALRWAGGPEIGKIDWRAAFVDLLADAADAFVPMVDLLTYHSRVNNPLLGRRRQGTYGAKPQLHAFGYGQRNISETQLENMWFELAGAQIAHTIIPLGAVELGWTPQTPETPDKPNTPSLRLHPIGRYMLGLTDDFDYHARPEGDVIIQPNFDVTFLGPSPRAEAKLGRLAERTGSRVGTLFRITRISILAAAAAGLTADQALSDLAEVSSKPLPENVKREVRGWFNATRHVHLRRTCLIDSPDAHTTTKVLAAAGKHAHQLTPTLVEITIPKKDQTTLIRKLKLSGIFVQ
jgi:hypothetical protein